MRRYTGFTLIEAMMVLTIAAILTAIAAPSFREFLLDTRMSNHVNDLIASLYLARSEAAKSNQPAVVCHAGDPFANPPACGGAWNDGWVVFGDANRNNAFDGTDRLITRQEGLPNGLTLQANANFVNLINYHSDGRAQSDINTLGTGTFLFCDERGAADARQVIIANTGRPRVAAGEGGGMTCP